MPALLGSETGESWAAGACKLGWTEKVLTGPTCSRLGTWAKELQGFSNSQEVFILKLKCAYSFLSVTVPPQMNNTNPFLLYKKKKPLFFPNEKHDHFSFDVF